jgi:hypothetical protein
MAGRVRDRHSPGNVIRVADRGIVRLENLDDDAGHARLAGILHPIVVQVVPDQVAHGYGQQPSVLQLFQPKASRPDSLPMAPGRILRANPWK